MFTKFYWSLWTLLALITVGLFAAGRLGWLEITVIGFVSCLFIFMGMMCVTPTLVGPHADEFAHGDAEPAATDAKPERKSVRERLAPATAAVQKRHA